MLSLFNSRKISTMPVPAIGAVILAVGTFGIGAGLSLESEILLSMSQAILVLVPSILVAYVSARSYLYTGSSNLLLLGTAVLAFGFSNLLGGITANLHPVISIAIFLIGGLVAGGLHAFSALLTFAPRLTHQRRPRLRLAVSYSGVLLFFGLISVVANVYPNSFPALGSVLERAVQGLTIILFFAAAFVFYRVYSKTRSPVLYWYMLALFLTALANLAFYSTQSFWDLVTWIGRLALYIASAYFLQAIIKARAQASSSKPASLG